MVDSIVLQDKVYDDMAHTFEASYVESLEEGSARDLMLDISNSRITDCWFLDAAEVDSLIDFLVLVRSKMGE